MKKLNTLQLQGSTSNNIYVKTMSKTSPGMYQSQQTQTESVMCDKAAEKEKEISARADGGPRSRVCARETLRSAPHLNERKFSGAHVCRVTFKHLLQPLRSHIRSTIGWGSEFDFFTRIFNYII